ncbi:MAG: hypothetical protein GWP15_02575 [Nitrospirae bacterium]|nr:hypothetical protein [Nitrospirota bacterium]
MPTKSTTKTEITLAKEVKELTKEVKKLKKLEFIKILKRPWKYMWMSFLHGLMVGFGWVIGASVLVALLIYLLAQIQFVPYLGDFVTDVIEEVKSIQPLVEDKIQNGTEDLILEVPEPVETSTPTK